MPFVVAAPTAMMNGERAGVVRPGVRLFDGKSSPSLPAATTTKMPAFHARSTACEIGESSLFWIESVP